MSDEMSSAGTRPLIIYYTITPSVNFYFICQREGGVWEKVKWDTSSNYPIIPICNSQSPPPSPPKKKRGYDGRLSYQTVPAVCVSSPLSITLRINFLCGFFFFMYISSSVDFRDMMMMMTVYIYNNKIIRWMVDFVFFLGKSKPRFIDVWNGVNLFKKWDSCFQKYIEAGIYILYIALRHCQSK